MPRRTKTRYDYADISSKCFSPQHILSRMVLTVEWLFWHKIWFASARIFCCASRQIFGRMVFERLSWVNNYFFLLLLNTLLCFQTLVRLVLSVCFGPKAVCFCSRTLLCLLSPESRHLTSVVEYMPYTSAVSS